MLYTLVASEPPQEERAISILNTYSYWRLFVTLRPVLFGTSENAEQHESGRIAHQSYSPPPVLPPDKPDTPLPPPDWQSPDFDDFNWWLDPGPFFGGQDAGVYGYLNIHLNRYGLTQPSTLALLCVRGKFTVTEPTKVKELRLSLEYRGGVVIYLNGHEVKRLHLRNGNITPLTLAEDYPLEASLNPDGTLLVTAPVAIGRGGGKEKAELRVRRASDIDLPVRYLRKGINVLALEIHRSAMPREMASVHKNKRGPTTGWFWNTVGLMSVNLTARGEGIIPNTARPQGIIQIWNANPLRPIFTIDYGEPHDTLRPVRIVGTRNGTFSGQVVVSSDKPLKGINAEISSLQLKQKFFSRNVGGNIIPRTNIKILWPQPTITSNLQPKFPYPPFDDRRMPVARFDALESYPPQEVKVWNKHPAGGAVQPIWISVNIPSDITPGIYEGTLAIRIEGKEPVNVPVSVEVYQFKLPAPANFETWADFIETPESLAFYYKVPFWSEQHWQLIESSLRFASRVGNKTLYVPLINRTNLANTQSMIRLVAGSDSMLAPTNSVIFDVNGKPIVTNSLAWVEGNPYQYDSSIAERYLDTAVRAGLNPRVVCVQVWDYHIGINREKLEPRGSYKIGTGMYGQLTVNEPQPVPVTLVISSTGEIKEIFGPRYVDSSAENFWKPVAERILQICTKRGMADRLMLGIAGDYVPPKEAVLLWKKLLPDAKWVTMAHGRVGNLFGVPVGYSVTVFGARYAVDPEIHRFYGWNNPEIVTYFPRATENACFPPAHERLAFEKGISGTMRGMGRQSLDDFAKRATSWGSSGCSWGSLTLAPCWLAPGTNRPISTIRFEMGIEGIQECEARITIEKALLNETLKAKLGHELAQKCQAVIDERTRCVILADEKGENGFLHSSMPGGPLGYNWFVGSDWQTRSANLYALAGEVADVLSNK